MPEAQKNPSTIAVGPESRARLDQYISKFEQKTGIRPTVASIVRRALAIGLDQMEQGNDQTPEERYR